MGIYPKLPQGGMTMSQVGYVRVSSLGQNLDRQIEAIGDVDELFDFNQSVKNIHALPNIY